MKINKKIKIKKPRIPLPQKVEKIIPDKKKEERKTKCRKKIREDQGFE